MKNANGVLSHTYTHKQLALIGTQVHTNSPSAHTQTRLVNRRRMTGLTEQSPFLQPHHVCSITMARMHQNKAITVSPDLYCNLTFRWMKIPFSRWTEIKHLKVKPCYKLNWDFGWRESLSVFATFLGVIPYSDTISGHVGDIRSIWLTCSIMRAAGDFPPWSPTHRIPSVLVTLSCVRGSLLSWVGCVNIVWQLHPTVHLPLLSSPSPVLTSYFALLSPISSLLFTFKQLPNDGNQKKNSEVSSQAQH